MTLYYWTIGNMSNKYVDEWYLQFGCGVLLIVHTNVSQMVSFVLSYFIQLNWNSNDLVQIDKTELSTLALKIKIHNNYFYF